jgi:hypothetical protein
MAENKNSVDKNSGGSYSGSKADSISKAISINGNVSSSKNLGESDTTFLKNTIDSSSLNSNLDLPDTSKLVGKPITDADIDKAKGLSTPKIESPILGYIDGYNIKKNENIRNSSPADLSDSPSIVGDSSESGARNITDSDKNISPGQNVNEIGIGDIGTLPSNSERKFRYDENMDFEDPTYLTFDIIMFLEQRALWDDNIGYGAYAFLKRNESISENFSRRVNYLNAFREQIKELVFTSEDNTEDLFDKKRPYYIENISGLDKLKQPIAKDDSNEITIKLSEDLKMSSEYLAELYNNLSYDYLYKRKAIPDNCLRFDMAIVISDVRKFKVSPDVINQNRSSSDVKREFELNPDEFNDEFGSNGFTFNGATKSKLNNGETKNQLLEIINPYVSRQIYILRDCNFDFSESYNVGSELSQGGFSGGGSNISDGLTFKIKYKSTERTMYADLFRLTKNGKGTRWGLPTHDLKFTTDNGDRGETYYRDKHQKISYIDNTYVKSYTNKPEKNRSDDDSKSNTSQGSNFFKDRFNSLTDSLVDTTLDISEKYLKQVSEKVRGYRGALLNTLDQEISNFTQLDQLGNVYDEDFGEVTLTNFVKELGGAYIDTITSEVQGTINDTFNNLGGGLI